MIDSDFHMHSSFSYDSTADMEEMIYSSICAGIQEICFTEHWDQGYFVNGSEAVFDTDTYMKKVNQMQKRYQNLITIYRGVELGLCVEQSEQYRSYVNQYPFDFVIGSLHCIDGMDPHEGTLFPGNKDADIYEKMFAAMKENILAFDDFDVLGHLDYMVRYSNEREAGYSYERYQEQIDEIWKLLIQKGKGIELNMAGLKYGLPFAHPIPEALRRYRELGGEIITIGSDAHMPKHVAYAFGKAERILQACGFDYYTIFENRIPVFKKI